MAWFGRARTPRGTRPELPSAVPGTSIFPGSGQWGDIPLPLPSSTTVLGLPAANRAKNLISDAVAQMCPMTMWTPDGFEADNPPNILTRPNSVYGCFDFFQMFTELAIMYGNSLGLLGDFVKGWAQQVVPVPPGVWLAYYDKAGYLVYNVNGKNYSAAEVVHVRANGKPLQPMGVGVVTQFRRSIGHALDQQNLAADTYRSGSVPAGIIELDLPDVDVTQATAVQTQWIANHSSGARAPAVLPNTMKFTPLQWSPEDLQFLQARHFSVAEIAYMFNLDPSDLGAALAGSSMTYANIEQRQQQRIIDSYAPWMRRFEDAWTDLIPGANVAKMVPDNLLRTDSKTRAEVHQLNLATEVETVDEARKSEGRRPLPKAPDVTALQGEQAPGIGVVMPNGAAPATNGAAPVDAASKPVPVPGDPNMTITPVKVKI